jgi:penicillin-binding protein 2
MAAFSPKVRESRTELVIRVRVLSVLMVISLLIILGGFWSVQIASGEQYRGLAEDNRLRRQPIESLRGLILDREGRILVENVASYNLLLHTNRVPKRAASLAFAGGILDTPPQTLEAVFQREGAANRFGAVLLAENLSLAEVARFGVAAFEHPEFEIQVRHLRLYRHGPQTAHVLGYLAEVTEKELATSPTPYRAGDQVGRRGIEQAYDDSLRGQDGERVVVVDNRGRLVEEFHQTPAREGSNLQLTLDLDLQQEAVELLRDHVGAVVALDPRDGAILALASSPSYDPNLFSRRLQREEWKALIEAPNDPLQNRALQNVYSPGSLFKVVMATAGLQEGVVGPNDRVWCGGSARFYNRRFRCWRRAGHGYVNLKDALKRSCDIYFYELGQRLGIQRIARDARLFGLGSPTGIDLAGEKAGLVPDLDWSVRARGTNWYPGETISVAIGQGPLLTTPLQVATMMAIVANGGQRVIPHLLLDWEPETPPGPSGLDSGALAKIRRGLWAVVNEQDGTGRRARIEGLDVAGKTGTVQVVAQRTWTDSSTLPPEQRDHAWFASFAPAEEARLVIVVFIEHGGKGSQAAAPIARALYEKFFEARLSDHVAI